MLFCIVLSGFHVVLCDHCCSRYPVTLSPASKPGSTASKEREKEMPSIRFKIQYQVVSVEPIKVYDEFIKVR